MMIIFSFIATRGSCQPIITTKKKKIENDFFAGKV
jgi:hypothetical protein